MRAVFRVDSGERIGLGHLSRCSVLALELTRRGMEVDFFSRRIPGAFDVSFFSSDLKQYWLSSQGIVENFEKVLPVAEQLKDAEQINSYLDFQPAVDLLVVDHYGLDHHFEINVNAKRVFAFDDFCSRMHSADFILDQAGQVKGTYDAFNRKIDFEELIGVEYALVRDKVVSARETYTYLNKNHILVYLGQGEVGEIVYNIVKKLLPYIEQRVTILLSKRSAFYSHINDFIVDKDQVTLMDHANDFVNLLSSASLFIGANGATSWERCCLGVPTVSFTLTENQKEIASVLNKSKAAYVIGEANSKNLALLPEVTERFKEDEYVKSFYRNSRSLCDGKGAQRVVDKVLAHFNKL